MTLTKLVAGNWKMHGLSADLQEIQAIAAQTRHKDLGVLVNRYIRPLEALATTSSRDLGL